MSLLQKGNSKLAKEVYQFNLPPIKTCTPSAWCREHCYALKGQYQANKKVIDACYNHNLEASRQDNFVLKICLEIKSHKNLKYIRIHAAGDFYSQEYIEKWTWIAYLNPQVKFLAFTKRRDLITPLMDFNRLPNAQIRESLDNSCKAALPFPKASIEGSNTLPGFICSGKCSGCFACWNDPHNVILPVH